MYKIGNISTYEVVFDLITEHAVELWSSQTIQDVFKCIEEI